MLALAAGWAFAETEISPYEPPRECFGKNIFTIEDPGWFSKEKSIAVRFCHGLTLAGVAGHAVKITYPDGVSEEIPAAMRLGEKPGSVVLESGLMWQEISADKTTIIFMGDSNRIVVNISIGGSNLCAKWWSCHTGDVVWDYETGRVNLGGAGERYAAAPMVTLSEIQSGKRPPNSSGKADAGKVEKIR